MSPVDREPGACNLDPSVHFLELFELSWEYLRHQHNEVFLVVPFQQLLHLNENVGATLSAKCPQNNPKKLSRAGLLDGCSPKFLHFLGIVAFFSQKLLERVILIEGHLRIPDHT